MTGICEFWRPFKPKGTNLICVLMHRCQDNTCNNLIDWCFGSKYTFQIGSVWHRFKTNLLEEMYLDRWWDKTQRVGKKREKHDIKELKTQMAFHRLLAPFDGCETLACRDPGEPFHPHPRRSFAVAIFKTPKRSVGDKTYWKICNFHIVIPNVCHSCKFANTIHMLI